MNDLQKLTHELLERRGICPKKGYGQNFLTDVQMLEKIGRSLPLDGMSAIVEIGPGLGFLTEVLLRFGLPVTVIEADPDMVGVLSDRFGEKIRIIAEDVRKVDFDLFHVKQTLFVGNLPYNLTKDIIEVLMMLTSPLRFSVMVQKEVALKLTGGSHHLMTNALAAFLGLKGNFGPPIDVPRAAFSPAPHVDSAFLNYRGCNPVDRSVYDFLKALYRQPKKTVANNLKAAAYDESLLPLKIGNLRPHQLTVGQLKNLVSLFVSTVI